jgi:hypothetical protein
MAKVEKDHEHEMARSQLSTMDRAIASLKKKLKGEGNLEAWVQSKLTKASDYVDSVSDYMQSSKKKIVSSEEALEMGTTELTNKYKKNTPGQTVKTVVKEYYLAETLPVRNPKPGIGRTARVKKVGLKPRSTVKKRGRKGRVGGLAPSKPPKITPPRYRQRSIQAIRRARDLARKTRERAMQSIQFAREV